MLTIIVHHENTSQNFNRKLDHLGYVGYHQKTKSNFKKAYGKGGSFYTHLEYKIVQPYAKQFSDPSKI